MKNGEGALESKDPVNEDILAPTEESQTIHPIWKYSINTFHRLPTVILQCVISDWKNDAILRNLLLREKHHN